MSSTEQAFTLIEVLITFVIIGILAAISFPQLTHFITQTDDIRLPSQLTRALTSAYAETQLKHLPIGICKSKNQYQCGGHWNDGLIVFIDEYQDGSIHNKTQIIRVMQTLAKTGQLNWRSFPRYRDYVLFSPNEMLQSDNGTFWYCHAGSARPAWALILNKSGRVRLVYPHPNGEMNNLPCLLPTVASLP